MSPAFDPLREGWLTEPASMVLLSDGYPDGGAQEILDLVRQHPHPPIDTVAISTWADNSCDKDLLRQIASMTGGKFHDVGDPLQLTQTMHLLLDYRREQLTDQASTTGTIAL